MAAAGSSGSLAYTHTACGATHNVAPVPALGEQPVASPAEGGVTTTAIALRKRPEPDLPRLRCELLDGSTRRSARVGFLHLRGERPVPRDLPDGLPRTTAVRDNRILDGVAADRRRAQLFHGQRLESLVADRLLDSEGNEDAAEGAPGVSSAAGDVRPDPHSAAPGLGEEELGAVSCLPPRMPRKARTGTESRTSERSQSPRTPEYARWGLASNHGRF